MEAEKYHISSFVCRQLRNKLRFYDFLFGRMANSFDRKVFEVEDSSRFIGKEVLEYKNNGRLSMECRLLDY